MYFNITFLQHETRTPSSTKEDIVVNGYTRNSLVEYVSQQCNITERNTEDVMDYSENETNTSDGSCLRGLVKSSGWLLLRENIGFRFINFCQFMQGLCYTVIMTHFVASVVYEGTDRQLASYLLSVVGITGLLSRLSNGWIIDRKLIAAEHLYFVPMALFGVATLMCRVFTKYSWYVICYLSLPH